MAILSSVWEGLNPHLLCYFFECDKEGNQSGDTMVKAPLTESNIDMALNWQSPFEQSGAEAMKPSMFAMLQSGELAGTIDAATNLASGVIGKDKAAAVQQKSKDFISQFEGRTGITRLNSIQTFASMPPVKIQVTALFRAWMDAQSEVEEPVDQLVKWALPIELARDGALANSMKAVSGDMKLSEALLPSKAPCLIGITYKNRTYAPLVIENIGIPIGSPITSMGNYIEMSVPMTLCTLTALDRNDYLKIIGS